VVLASGLGGPPGYLLGYPGATDPLGWPRARLLPSHRLAPARQRRPLPRAFAPPLQRPL